MDGASQQVASFATKTEAQLATVETAFKTIALAAATFGAYLVVKEVYEFGKAAVQTSIQMQQLEFQLIASTGSTKDAGLAMDFCRELADKLGLKILDVGKGFSMFALNAIGSGMSLKETEKIYTAFNEATLAVGVSNAGVGRTMYALAEIMTQPSAQLRQLRMLAIDGRISFEEMGKALGVNGEQFLEMVKKGKVVTEDFLPKLAAQLDHDFGTIAVAASQTLQGNLNRLDNKWVELQTTFGKTGGLQGANVAVAALANVLDDLKPVAAAVADEFLGLEILAADLVKYWKLLEDEVGALTDDLMSLGGAVKAVGTASEQLLEGHVSGAMDTLKAASSALNKQLDDTSANAKQRSKEVTDQYNATVKAILKPYSMPDIEKDETAPSKGGEKKGITDSKRHAVAEQVRHVEEYGDDEGDKLKSQLAEHQKTLENALKLQVITKQKFDTDMEAIQKDYDKRMAAYVAKTFGDEMDVENEDFKERKNALEKALKDKLITQQKYDEMMEKAQKDHQKKLIKAENDYNNQRRSMSREAIDGFLGIQSDYQQRTTEEQGASFRNSISQAAQYNKAFFELDKAAKIAQALLSARQSVVDAYAFGTKLGGPGLGLAFAGVAAAAQAANIAAIASTSFGSSGGVSTNGGGDPGISTASDAPSPNSGVTGNNSKVIHLTIQGSGFTPNDIRKLIDDINDELDNGSTLNVA